MINPDMYLMIMDRLNIKVVQAVKYGIADDSRAWAGSRV